MKKKFYFGFRIETQLDEKIRTHCRKEGISLNLLVYRALTLLGGRYDTGRINLFEPSRFRTRPDRDDRKNTSLILSAKMREMVRNLAFTYRISMAEVIRLGLEMYLELHDVSKSDKTIHTYRQRRPLIHTVIIFLYPAIPKNTPPYPLLL